MFDLPKFIIVIKSHNRTYYGSCCYVIMQNYMILCCQCYELLENLLSREAHNVNKTEKAPREKNFGKEVLIIL